MLDGPYNNEEFGPNWFTYKIYEKTKIKFNSWNGHTTLIPSSNCANRYTPVLTDYNSCAVDNSSLHDESPHLEVDKSFKSSRMSLMSPTLYLLFLMTT